MQSKLVRDRIIEIIEKAGVRAKYHPARPEEYWPKLKEKLEEEGREFLGTETQEEMADIFEVISAVLAEKGWTIDDIVAVQKKKREERGGFEKKIILNG